MALLAASIPLSLYLPKCLLGPQTRSDQIPMAAAVGLSFGLISLCILETAPSTWCVLLSTTQRQQHGTTPGQNGIFPLESAYWVLLWTLSLLVLIVLPSLAGASLVASLGNAFDSCRAPRDHDNRKYSVWKTVWWRRNNCPVWLRFFCGLVQIILHNLYRLCQTIITPRRSTGTELPGISLSLSEDELLLRQSTSGDLELRGGFPPGSNHSVSTSGGGNGGSSTVNPHKSGCYWEFAVGSVSAVSIVLVLARTLGPTVVAVADNAPLPTCVSWLCAIGLVTSALLNGFGSVSMPYSCLVGLYLEPVRPTLISKLETELQNLRETMAKKRTNLREMPTVVGAGKQGSSNGTGTGRNGKVQQMRTFADLREELSNRRQILQTEIDFLEILSKEMSDDIEELRYSQMVAGAARTKLGKIRSYVGLLFSVILFVRLVSAGNSIWRSYSGASWRHHHHSVNKDTITNTLVWLMGHRFVSPSDYTMLSQVISLALTAVLSFTQIRSFLHAVAAIHRYGKSVYTKCNCGRATVPAASRSLAALTDDSQGRVGSSMGGTVTGSGLTSSLIAGVMGCYSLSCVVLIKMMLPRDFRADFDSALGGMDVFVVHGSIINMIFAGSAAVSFSILGVLFGIQRQNNLRHTMNDSSKVSRGADMV